MTDDRVTIRQFLAALLVCAHAMVRALIVALGWQWSKEGRRIYR